jgi:predicted short-subunit dehydrogenase-like oxidoreductase (DUF2520 family)
MTEKIKTVIIVGAGNVATQLAHTLSSLVKIEGIISRSSVSAKALASEISCRHLPSVHDFPPCDLVLICVNDSAITEVEASIPSHFKVAYTAGSMELNFSTTRKNIGVFYPLQTFSKSSTLNLSEVPFFIEASTVDFSKSLFVLAEKISSKVTYSNSENRKKIHLAAVFVNNFVNHLAFLAKEYTEQNELDWEHLEPLLEETTQKIIVGSPFEAQTGPAKRNDQLIIQEHKKMLSGLPREIYDRMTESILQTYSTDNK